MKARILFPAIAKAAVTPSSNETIRLQALREILELARQAAGCDRHYRGQARCRGDVSRRAEEWPMAQSTAVIQLMAAAVPPAIQRKFNKSCASANICDQPIYHRRGSPRRSAFVRRLSAAIFQANKSRPHRSSWCSSRVFDTAVVTPSSALRASLTARAGWPRPPPADGRVLPPARGPPGEENRPTQPAGNPCTLATPRNFQNLKKVQNSKNSQTV